MIRRCREAGLPDVEFTIRDGFVTTIQRPKSRLELGAKRRESEAERLESRLESGAERPKSRPKSRPESRPESNTPEPESLEGRVLILLEAGALRKAELADAVGHRMISGQLKKVFGILLADQMIEWTIPNKPRSRFQKYRITDKGRAHLAALRKGTAQ